MIAQRHSYITICYDIMLLLFTIQSTLTPPALYYSDYSDYSEGRCAQSLREKVGSSRRFQTLASTVVSSLSRIFDRFINNKCLLYSNTRATILTTDT